MQFLKKHYEKILLGIVLAGLIGVLVFMLFYIAHDKELMDEAANTLTNPKVNRLPDLDLATNSDAMTRLQSPYLLDFETGNKVFNPFEWQKTLDGQLVKKASLNAHVAVVTNITPLYLVLRLDSVMTNELGVRYNISVENQAAATPSKRTPHHHYVSVGDKPNDTFELTSVKGNAENPDALNLRLLDTGEIATVKFNQPFRRPDAYIADFRYDPEKKVFHNCRIGSKASFGGVDYMVVEVDKNELILEDQSNQKKTSLPFTP